VVLAASPLAFGHGLATVSATAQAMARRCPFLIAL